MDNIFKSMEDLIKFFQKITKLIGFGFKFSRDIVDKH